MPGKVQYVGYGQELKVAPLEDLVYMFLRLTSVLQLFNVEAKYVESNRAGGLYRSRSLCLCIPHTFTPDLHTQYIPLTARSSAENRQVQK